MKASIIGSGIAGLASSVRLASAGYEVDVFEANTYPGGKLSEISCAGYRFDAGPSLFTMPHLVDELFTLAGKDPSDYFTYRRKEVSCHYFWDDGTRFQAPASMENFIERAGETFDADRLKLARYLKETERLYNLTRDTFLAQSLHKPGTYLRPATLKTLANAVTMPMLSTLHQENVKRLGNPKLVQLFDRFATYNGSNPYRTPGIMMLIPFLEFGIGTFFPEKGMHSITTSIHQLALDIGVQFHFDTKVERIEIERGHASHVVTSGRKIPADVVVSNMDIYPTYRKLMPSVRAPEKVLKQERSSSALIFYWGMKSSFPELDLHNIFFSSDYEKEFHQIFTERIPGEDPTVYINITSKEKADDAPENCENWFVMINVPPNEGQDWDELIDLARERIIKKVSQNLGRDIRPLIETEAILDPRSIESKTSSYQGALYGTSSNNRLAAFLRHPNFKSSIPNLFFCGGSVHPGGGIPLCLLSASIVSDLVPAPGQRDISANTGK